LIFKKKGFAEMKKAASPILFMLMASPALAQDMSGKYCVLTESEWSECIELNTGGACRIVTEVWEATDGSGPRKDYDRKETTCSYEVRGGQVLLTHHGVTEALKADFYDWKEELLDGWSPGLKPVEPRAEKSVLSSRVYWKEPMDELRVSEPPRR
jgi:hypothetical protein